MSTNKLLVLIGVIAIAGFGAYWYVENMEPKEVVEAETEMEDGDDKVDTMSDSNNSSTDTTPRDTSTVNTNTESENSIDADLNALDQSFADDYDDSDLDSTFTSEGANSLTNSYDY